MKKLFVCVLLSAALWPATSSSAAAGELKLTIGNGRVTLIAQDVPLRQILNEWARVGETRFVNVEKLVGPSLTLQLTDVPEKQALDILLHSASGYMVASRPAGAAGASVYDRVMILASSRGPTASVSAAPAPFTRPMMQPQPQPPPPAVEDDDGEPGDQLPVPPPGMVPPGMPPGTTPPGMSVPGMMPPTAVPGAQPQPFPGAAPQPGQQPGQQQVPMTAPRPGMLPTPPQGTPGNPYQPYPPQPNTPNPPRRPGGGE